MSTLLPSARVRIDTGRCQGCGLCVALCPSRTFRLEDGLARVTGAACIGCDHCAAICPAAAVSVEFIDPEAQRYASFVSDENWLPPGDPACDPSRLVQLMRSRRSCRCFKDKPVPRALLDDLVKIGITAPSGTNSQRWTFTVLPTRPAVEVLARGIGDFFRHVNSMAEKSWLRAAMKLAGKPDLDHYYHEYYTSVKAALADFDRDGTDKLFHGAPATIVVGMRPGASCPAEDALLATQNILLGAHCLGLGTCLIGYAVSAMANDKKVKRTIDIPDNETVYAVIALGYPATRWERLTGRRTPVLRYFEG